MKLVKVSISILLCFTVSIIAVEQDIAIKKHAMQLSFETIPVTSVEDMGMVGVHVRLDQEKWSRVYLGVGGYGALIGDRGGFFTAGITPGIQIPLYKQVKANIGVFLGGGGGASAFPGDGAMIRAHAYLGNDFQYLSTWVGVSSQRISNVKLGESLVWSLSIPFYTAIPIKQKQDIVKNIAALRSRKLTVSPSIASYRPNQSATGRDNQPLADQIALLGMDIETSLYKNIKGLFTLYAANGDRADGYGKIMTGLGYRFLLIPKLSLYPYAQYGMSGGGNIHTGGGLIWQVGLRAVYDMSNSVKSHAFINHIESHTGTFKALFLGAGLNYSFNTLEPVVTDSKTILDHVKVNLEKVKQKQFYWFLGNKTVFPESSLRDKNSEAYETQIDSVALGLEFPIKDGFRFITTTYWAYTGDVGAYAEGCFGYVIQKKLLKKVSLYQQTEMGAAGGGGINVNQGTIYQSMLGLGYHLNDTQTIKIQLGWQGSFSQDSFQGVMGILSLDIRRSFLIKE